MLRKEQEATKTSSPPKNLPLSLGKLDPNNSASLNIRVSTTPGCTEHTNISGCSCAMNSISLACAIFELMYPVSLSVRAAGNTAPAALTPRKLAFGLARGMNAWAAMKMDLTFVWGGGVSDELFSKHHWIHMALVYSGGELKGTCTS